MPTWNRSEAQKDITAAVDKGRHAETSLQRVRAVLRGLRTSRPSMDFIQSGQRARSLMDHKSAYERIHQKRSGNSNYTIPEELQIKIIDKAESEQLDSQRLSAAYFIHELLSKGIRHISVDDILRKVERYSARDNQPARQIRIEDLSFGLELELGKFEALKKLGSVEYRQAVDALQYLGIPITYDSIREVPLPHSIHPTEQLRAIITLTKLGIINLDQKVTVHINTGNLAPYLSENLEEIYFLQMVMEMTNIFGRSEVTGEFLIPVEGARKDLLAGYWTGVEGLPFVVKNDELLEWRGFPFKDFLAFSKGVLTLNDLMQPMSCYMRQQAGESMSLQQLELAETWKEFKAHMLSLAEKYHMLTPWQTGLELAAYPQHRLNHANSLDEDAEEQVKEYQRIKKDDRKRMEELLGKKFTSNAQYENAVLNMRMFGRVRAQIQEASHEQEQYRTEVMQAVIALRAYVSRLSQE